MRKLKLMAATLMMVVLRVCYLEAQASKTMSKPAASSLLADPQKIRAHVRFLSGDLLEGRGTGQRGGDIAAEYLATQFALYGLQPAGDQGTYFQEVPMMEVKTLEETSFNLVASNVETITLKNLEDFVTSNESQAETAYIDAPIVFVGYGIDAPEYNWDDYKGTDLRGKVVLLFVNEPASDDPKFFKGKALTYYGRWSYKFEETARRGAVATLNHPPHGPCELRVGSGAQFLGKGALLPEEGRHAKVAGCVMATTRSREETCCHGRLDLDQLCEQAQSKDFKPIELPVRLQAHIASQLRPFVSRNVLAALPAWGSRSQEAVLYTAHYDHLGIDRDMKGHNIYNGAVDNATGCGVLLEVARLWSQTPAVPPRMILFAGVTAEEQGLLGSENLGKHSPEPPGKISLDLNYDVLALIGDPEEVEVSGAERTTFYSAVEEKAKTFGLAIRP